MPEELIVRHCSPTLAGIKTGSMFVCTFDSRQEMLAAVREMNLRFSQKGLRAVPLESRNNRTLVYVYRPGQLRRDLCDSSAEELLETRGYRPDTPESCVAHLRKRLSLSEDFPHEIGLFLGYPPEDVRGFIENRSDFKLSGPWKVYGDEDRAQKLFARYKKCTAVYSAQHAKGRSIDRLAVNI